MTGHLTYSTRVREEMEKERQDKGMERGRDMKEQVGGKQAKDKFQMKVMWC